MKSILLLLVCFFLTATGLEASPFDRPLFEGGCDGAVCVYDRVFKILGAAERSHVVYLPGNRSMRVPVLPLNKKNSMMFKIGNRLEFDDIYLSYKVVVSVEGKMIKVVQPSKIFQLSPMSYSTVSFPMPIIEYGKQGVIYICLTYSTFKIHVEEDLEKGQFYDWATFEFHLG